MIALHQLEKVFHVGEGGVAALRGVHLQMEREEFFVLLGPSGSGKTTLLRCVAGGYVFKGGYSGLENIISLTGARVFVLLAMDGPTHLSRADSGRAACLEAPPWITDEWLGIL